MPRTQALHWWSLQPDWNWNWTDHIVPRTHFLPALWSLIRSSWASDGSIFTEFGPRFRNIPHTPIHSQSRTGPCIGGVSVFFFALKNKDSNFERFWRNIFQPFILWIIHLQSLTASVCQTQILFLSIFCLNSFIPFHTYICVFFYDFHFFVVVLC